jgi:hypothetical protein
VIFSSYTSYLLVRAPAFRNIYGDQGSGSVYEEDPTDIDTALNSSCDLLIYPREEIRKGMELEGEK